MRVRRDDEQLTVVLFRPSQHFQLEERVERVGAWQDYHSPAFAVPYAPFHANREGVLGQFETPGQNARRKELDKIRCSGLAQWNVANMCQFVEVQRAFGVCVLVLFFVLFQCVSPFGWHDHLAPLLKVDAPSPEHREYDVRKASLEQ